ncbi:g9560 [Coccomyxa elongata]
MSRSTGRKEPLRCSVASSEQLQLQSEAERFVESLQSENASFEEPASERASLQAQYDECKKKLGDLQTGIDAAYSTCFSAVSFDLPPEDAEILQGVDFKSVITEAYFGELGRSHPKTASAILAAKQKSDPLGWQKFQETVHAMKNQRTRAVREAEDLQSSIFAADTALRLQQEGAVDEDDGEAVLSGVQALDRDCRIVLISGFESFNVDLYKKAARRVARECPGVQVRVFSDRDIISKQAEVDEALKEADVFFGSLLFDYDQVEWLRKRVQQIPIRLVFESALELMGTTQLGGFKMDPSGKSKGPPPAVKKVLSLFGSGREEDRMVGYLSFLKIGPKLLKFLPGQKVRDLRNWLTIYSYWNQGGQDNVATMLLYLVDQYVARTGITPPPVQETPPTGCLHPDYDGYFGTPTEYLAWYAKHGALRDRADAPTVAVLLYRKHVITRQGYIAQLVRCFEEDGVRPVPIFINGIEAHTVVRDLLTTEHEQQLKAQGKPGPASSLKRDAAKVDAFVSTIGFPLVGGPAGTMEGGRQAHVAKSILAAKNVPYVVAAPLLIQDLASWTRDGVAGLQSVVLYSLPELDGAIDTVPLGGLVGDNIFLVPERVKRLSARLRKWVHLRRTPPQERKVALLLYGFPPGVGATGTAALLNVPKSLERMLEQLQEQGYDLGDAVADGAKIDGEAIVNALRLQEDQRAIFKGAAGIEQGGAGDAEHFGAHAAAADVSPKRLKELLTYPASWGPSEWGPISFLPEHNLLVSNMERQWGDLDKYRGLATSAKGNFVVSGLQLGNVWIGVQPALGVEGDPMRLLFERDLTPHPQYAAFYKWLQHEYVADAVLHFGMHGTVEWLPGAPLGNSGFSWSDVLLGDLPNVYVYAANNPSESIIAKRRGYGTIVSHNVPPYGRAGLYKQLAELKALVAEYREDPAKNAALKVPIVENLTASGLQEDCPFLAASSADNSRPEYLTAETVEAIDTEAFAEYAGRLNQYLQVVEGRLFSEGLHVLGQPPSPDQMRQYLSAYFGEGLPEAAVDAVVKAGDKGIEAVRQQLERTYAQASMHSPGDASTSGHMHERLEEGLRIAGLLRRNTEEMSGVLRALNGEYILPEAGGDLLRDGAGVLPTGRNIHALDPYRMPSQAALERGSAVAKDILDGHREANGGAWPETVAVNLWGLDAIKTKGESVAVALYMVGARPVREGTGRIARFELVPLAEMGGRPRVDVLCNMSGIFRDSFQNVVELLDDLFQRAAAADEPPEQNYIRKHVLEMKGTGLTNPAARLFSNPAGDYGSMVNERVGAGNWESGQELGDTWASRNAFSYGRGNERGTARPEVLQSLLKTTDRVVQEIDSVEYGLTDIQEYYANTGALKQAAESARGGRKVGCSIVETFSKSTKPRELEEVLRLEYRSKLLNPKWAEAMANQGSGGAYEISQRMTAMVGWGATADFREDWTWDQAAETYALDPAMAEKLRKNNPQAFANVVRRMMEASGRGMWNASEETLDQLRSILNDIEDELEGVK